MIEELLLDIDNIEVFDFESTFALYKRVSEIIIKNEVIAQRLIVNILDNGIATKYVTNFIKPPC